MLKGHRAVKCETNFDDADLKNLKRVRLLFDRITNECRQIHPLNADISWLNDLYNKAKTGIYFEDFDHKGDILPRSLVRDKGTVAYRGVNWQLVAEDIQIGYSVSNSEKFEMKTLPESISDEIVYEIERQNLETPKPMPPSKMRIKSLLDRNGQPMFPGKWRKEAYALRQYDPINEYVVAGSVDPADDEELKRQLDTTLDGFLGPAYNYDDRSLTEEWMLNFRDSMATPPSEDDIIRSQIEGLMEIMIGKVQDKVCNDLEVLKRAPLGLGPALEERPVWGMDCHTTRMIELILQDEYLHKQPAEDGLALPHCEKDFRRFIEKTLLPAINAVPTPHAHRIDLVLKHIIKNPLTSVRDALYAETVLTASLELDSEQYLRIHPKGTGVICTAKEGIAAHVVIAEYLGEMYPPYRWCEKLEVVQQAQKSYELKPTLPDFYNILLERPRKDDRGYGLIFVDASQRANLGSSCSHSCDANCTSAVVARNGRLCITLTTNRHVSYGEELCMDYYSITTSEVEWRAAICLCGSLACRGSFLHLATQDDLQQVLNQGCGPVLRVASLLRGCSGRSLSASDQAILAHHGIGDIALGNNSALWLKKFVIDNLRFVEYERKALPCALLRSRDGSPSPYTYSSADMDARCVLEQRLQSLVCCCSLVSRFLSRQPEKLRAAQPLRMLSAVDTIPLVWGALKPIPRLLQKHLVNALPAVQVEGGARSRAEAATSALKDVFAEVNVPATTSLLKEKIRVARDVLVAIKDLEIPTARLTLLVDVLNMWINTTNFAQIQEYEPIYSEPVEVVARELGTTTIAKDKIKKLRTTSGSLPSNGSLPQTVVCAASGENGVSFEPMEVQSMEEEVSVGGELSGNGHIVTGESLSNNTETNINTEGAPKKSKSTSGQKRSRSSNQSSSKSGVVSLHPNEVIYTGKKAYDPSYVFWQCIGWFNAGTDQESSVPDLLGTCILPAPATCFGSVEGRYTTETRDQLHAHLMTDRSQAQPWPSAVRRCFSEPPPGDTPLIGSPVLDVALGRVDAVERCLDDMFGADRRRTTQDFGQFDSNLPPEKPTEWVQCERCLKWRRVPFHINIEELPEEWTCELNFWDEPEKASCDAPQDYFDPDKENTVGTCLPHDVTEEMCTVGTWKDVFCLRNKIYYEAQVKSIRDSKKIPGKREAKFHFKGWKSCHDEWVEIGSERIAPHHFFTDATTTSVRQQEKWQGYKGETKPLSGNKRSASAVSTSKRKSKAKVRKSK